MIRRLFVLFFVLALFTLAGCNSPEATPVAEAPTTAPTKTTEPTKTAKPTETAVPPTHTATATNTPTQTAVPTETATATPTKTPTNTATPLPTETAVPKPTNTLAATIPAAPTVPPPVAAPLIGEPPAGPNLIVNPGFENGTDAWNVNANRPTRLEPITDFPNFIHSGAYSGFYYMQQTVGNIQPGINYRAGAWVKLWASNGEDREVSDTPGYASAKICINTNGEGNLSFPTTICSPVTRTHDVWQYITVDAIPINDRVMVMLVGSSGPADNRPIHTAVLWDDVAFGISPVTAVATATVPPLGRPGPPAPIAFNAVALRDGMNSARSNLEQMGGLLDRLVRGSTETCLEYDGYYRGLVASPRFDGVPPEWQALYNEYIFAVDHSSLKNQPIFDLCFEHQGGGISELNYSVARTGVNESLDRLIPAIEAANGMLGQ